MKRVAVALLFFLACSVGAQAQEFRAPTAEELETLNTYGLREVNLVDDSTARLLKLKTGAADIAEIERRGNSPRIKTEGKKVCPEFARRLAQLIKNVEAKTKGRKVCIDSLMRTQAEQDRNCRTGASGFGSGKSCDPTYGSAHQVGLAADLNCSMPCYPRCSWGSMSDADKDFVKTLHAEISAAGLSNPVIKADPFHVEMSRKEAQKAGCPATPQDFARLKEANLRAPRLFAPSQRRVQI